MTLLRGIVAVKPVWLDENKVALFQQIFLFLDPHIHFTGDHQNKLIATMHVQGEYVAVTLVEHKMADSDPVFYFIQQGMQGRQY